MSVTNPSRSARRARREHVRLHRPDADALYREALRSHAVLDATEETARANAVLDAEAALVRAIATTPGGRDAMRELSEELAASRIDPRAVLLNPDGDAAALARDVARASAALSAGEHAVFADLRLETEILARLVRKARCPAVEDAARAFARAKHELVLPNLRLVVMFARKYETRGTTLADLVQDGNIGLMRAAEKFDPRRAIRFSTYASFWIKQALQRSLTQRHVRLPVYVAEERRRVNRARGRLAIEHEREPTVSELSHATGLPVERVNVVLSLPPHPASLDAPLGDEGSASLLELLSDDSMLAEEAVGAAQLRRQLVASLASLTPREAEILELRFGLGRARREHTLDEIGRSLSLTRERVRQIERAALDKLRSSSHGKTLSAHLAG